MSDATPAGKAQEALKPGSQSPISQLLITLGMTREDLTRHSVQMREFLTTETSTSSRPLTQSAESSRSVHSIQSKQLVSLSQTTNVPPSTRGPSPSVPSHTHTALTPPPSQSAYKQTPLLKAASYAHKLSSTTRDATAMSRGNAPRNRKQQPQATSPTRHKPNLDEIMMLRSRALKHVSEPEDSDSSDEASCYELHSVRKNTRKNTTRVSPYCHQPYHSTNAPRGRASSSSSFSEPQSASKYYRQQSPVIPAVSSGNYYRRHDESKTPITPTSTSNERQRRTTPASSHNSTPTRRRELRQESLMREQPFTTSQAPSSPLSSSPNFQSNLASSPGPLVSSPAGRNDPDLPFELPPGPYSDRKPELSYAALIGRAILASPDHRLRLKDIYDYISIVFPYFKRDGHSHGQKWMNAIRQNLTNTPQFHKSGIVDAATKSSYWSIKNVDLPCFVNGGYNRHALSPDGAAAVGSRGEKRKRKEDVSNVVVAKKPRAILPPVARPQPPNPYHFPYGYPHIPLHFPMPGQPMYIDQSRIRADMVFPPLPSSHPNAHLVVNRVPMAENDHVIFPPLPASSQTRIAREARLKAQAQQESEAEVEAEEEEEEEAMEEEEEESDTKCASVTPPPLPSSDMSSMSLPDLTSNDSSSSPPVDPPTDDGSNGDDGHAVEVTQAMTEEDDFMDMIVNEPAEDDRFVGIPAIDKGKGKATAEDEDEECLQYLPLPPMPTTPTARRRPGQSNSVPASQMLLGIHATSEISRDAIRASTPPPKSSVLLSAVSLMQTPTSSKGLPSTPMRGSVRFELLGGDGEDKSRWNDTLPRTPSRVPSKATSSTAAEPITPKKFFSPFSAFSPYRTPSRRTIVDPSDPSAILDEELSALASASRQGTQESPVGFFAHGKGLLYESPNFPSPSRWRPW